ncbi:MAG: hypothetical protein IJR94_02670 [Synergistaceae bacterium]|nr:hypothetical protein [Synergistaceae bacterium]
MQHAFYGAELSKKIHAQNKIYPGIDSPSDLYDALSKIWCEYSCAPRMRSNWSEENITLGQCSITAFLAQDIFGGNVFGVLRPDGNFHCYNLVEGVVFDLTSEQFQGEALDYSLRHEQSRAIHFSKQEKKERYEYLKAELGKKFQGEFKLC